MRTNNAVALRTTGSTRSKVGKATSQDIAQAPNQSCPNPGASPIALSVLTIETMNVINTESSSGITMLLYRGGSFLTNTVRLDLDALCAACGK